MNPGSLPRSKSSVGEFSVNMAVRNVDSYSPILKGSKSEPWSQISVHSIPVLIFVVFLLLWVGSKDLGNSDPIANPEKLVMRVVTSANITATSDKLQKPHSSINSLPNTKEVPHHVSSSHSDRGTSSLKIGRKEANRRQHHMRGDPRQKE